MTSRPVLAGIDSVQVAGTWRIFAHRPGQAPIELTFFRGQPTGIGAWSFADPFGPKTASFTFPKITMFDRPGVADLFWCAYGTDLDIVWEGPTPYPGGFRVETYIVSFDYSSERGLEIQCAGAMYQLDNYLAKPLHLTEAITYEDAISLAFQGHPDLRLNRLRLEFPFWWRTRRPSRRRVGESPTEAARRAQQQPRSTGLVTRETGNWDPSLTSYVQTLLSSMYTDRGRWTLDLDTFRNPVMRHRTILDIDDPTLLVLDPALPGVSVSLSVDWSQSLNVAYGQGTSLAGEGFTGANISSDGSRTTYEPLASLRQVHPVTDENGWLELSRMRKEVNLQAQQGLTYSQAQGVGQAHLSRYADPGITGSITTKVDPVYGTQYLPRALIKAGMSIRLPNVFGDKNGPVLSISEVTTDLAQGTVTMTVDSKYRDALTVDEVRVRGRDSLAVVRQLIGGQYAPTIPDQLLPWNYAEGSGFIPSGPDFSCVDLFDGMPDDITFPYEEWTTSRPPSDPSWTHSYMKIAKRRPNADLNWAASFVGNGLRLAFPVRMAQAGTIRRIQIAAYDVNGNVVPVRFHFSLYKAYGTGVTSMPRITALDRATADGYAAGQHYPFFGRAWETVQADGTKISTEDPTAVSSAGLVRGWGTRFVRAGYWPGSSTSNDPVTGLMVDEAVFEFDTTDFDQNFNPHVPRQVSSLSGHLYCMVYCDDNLLQDVYFMGRLFRAEPGAAI